MASLLPLFVAIPLLSAAVLIIFPGITFLSRALILLVPSFSLIYSVLLLNEHRSTPVIAEQIGGWPAGIAIPFVSDTFTALMLCTTSLLILACNYFSIASKDAEERYFAPLVLILSAGVAGALLTADLFNLFVFIELMFLPSCGLFIMRKGLKKLESPRLYVSVNLLTSAILVIGIALVYATTGTINIASLAGAATESTLTAAAVGVIFIALSIKAALLPMHGWLARTYPATSPVVSALFSGLHTKVAVYALYRLYAVIFDGTDRYLWFFTLLFAATMVTGAFGALGETTTRSILAFHMVSQIGYIMMGVALFGPLGLTAGIFYLIHHMIVKASLFLSVGAIEETYGTGRLSKLSGIAKSDPVVAVGFFCAALSLTGIPPFSGFIAKFTLLSAAIEKDNMVATVSIVAVSIITLVSMLKIWSTVFWTRQEAHEEVDQRSVDADTITRVRISKSLLAPGLILALVSLILGINADLLLGFAERAADSLINTELYIKAVLP